ncbi:hypothetical protein N7475_006074 [Penicillium sp. IBT 31633x]|nr:hypothetical protein N7475_006074 [Penicillium sp. IBT 31633x]
MLPHTIERQMILHKPQGSEKDLRYKGKAWTRDVVTTEHQLCAVLPNLGSEEIDVCPLWKAEGYNVHCGPTQRDMKPNFMPKEFFTRHGIVGIDYATLARPYSNSLLDSDGEDLYQEKDTNNIVESGDLPGSCAGVTSSSDQTVNTHSTSEMDVDMETDSMADIPQIVPEQKQVQLPKVITELAPAQVPNQLSELVPEQVPEQALKQPKEEATDVIMEQGPEDNNGNSGLVHSSLEDNPGVDSSATASHGHDLNMIIEDLNIKISESTASKQTDNAVIFPSDTSPERATIVPQTTSVQLIVEQPEADTTGEISTSEPATMEQVANDQPGSEKSFQTAADDLPEKPSFTEHPTAQPAPDNDIELSAKAPVENGD